MIASINQPAYLPWLGYFHRIASSDIHIILDHVPFEKNSFTNRNKVRTKNGWCWLTVPVMTKGRFGGLYINQIEIANDTRWRIKHWETIKSNYSKAQFFDQHGLFFKNIYSCRWDNLIDLLRVTNSYLLKALGISTPILFSSEMNVQGRKDELIRNLCHSVGATEYLSGPLGKNYLREDLFEEGGIKVIYQNYRHPNYQQTYHGFEPYMAITDLLFNHGPKSLEILMKDQEELRI